MKKIHGIYGALFGAAVCALSGCASVPAPTAQMAVSQSAIDTAQSAGASQYSPAELAVARQKLDHAHADVQAGRDVEARREAEEAEVDAQLAQAHAMKVKSTHAVGEVDKGNQALQKEIDRNATQQMPSNQ